MSKGSCRGELSGKVMDMDEDLRLVWSDMGEDHAECYVKLALIQSIRGMEYQLELLKDEVEMVWKGR